MYTTYCLKKTSAERFIDDIGGDQNAFLQVNTGLTPLIKPSHCPSVRLSTQNFSNFNELWYVDRGR